MQNVRGRFGCVDCVQRTWTCRRIARFEDLRLDRESVGDAVVRRMLRVAYSEPGSRFNFIMTIVSMWVVPTGSRVWVIAEEVFSVFPQMSWTNVGSSGL